MEADPKDQRASTATRVLEGGQHRMGVWAQMYLSLSLSMWLLGLNWGMTQIETGCSIRPKLVCNFLIKKSCQVIALLDT